MKALRAGQVALDPDLSGMPHLRFLKQVGVVALIIYMSDWLLKKGRYKTAPTGSAQLPKLLRFRYHWIAQDTDTFDLNFNSVPGRDGTHAGGRTGHNHVAGQQGHHRADVGNQVSDRKH